MKGYGSKSSGNIIAKRKANNGPTPKNPSAMKPTCDGYAKENVSGIDPKGMKAEIR